jgi:hypothetical protein
LSLDILKQLFLVLTGLCPSILFPGLPPSSTIHLWGLPAT